MSADYRYELKFVLTPAQHAELDRWRRACTLLREAFPGRQVNSVYLDNIQLHGVRDNLAGLPDRAKHRIRWYGEDEQGGARDLRFEIKTRTGRLGGKTTYALDALQADFLRTPLSDTMPALSDILRSNCREESVVLNQLFPVLFIEYEREYFEDPEGIRLTVDTHVRYRNLQLSDRPGELAGIGNHAIVAELKFTAENKNRVSAMLANFHFVPQRNSKYLNGMAMAGVATYI